MKCSLGISNFLEEISSLSILLFPLFLCNRWGRLSYLSSLFFRTLHSNVYLFPFLLCFSLLFFSQLFVRPPQTVILLYWPTRPSWINTPKIYPFHYRGLECKRGKSRNTWDNRQIWPWSTEWSRANVNGVLQRECTGRSKHPLPTTQEKTSHAHHQMVNTEIRLIILFAAKDGKALYSHQKQDGELTVAQIMNTLLPNSGLKK